MAPKGREVIHSQTHQLPADYLPSADAGDLAGTRQSQPLLSEFTVKNHQPRSHVKVGGLGPKDSVGVSCGGGRIWGLVQRVDKAESCR